MNIKRFHAPTAREALAKARMAFGDGTLILSNRPTDNGVEVVATAEDSLDSLQTAPQVAPQLAQHSASNTSNAHHGGMPSQRSQPSLQERADDLAASTLRRNAEVGAARSALPNANPAQDAEQLAMSTLSFQDYVRERMLRRRHEALHGSDPSHGQAGHVNGAAMTLAERAQREHREQRPAPLKAASQPLPAAAPRERLEHTLPGVAQLDIQPINAPQSRQARPVQSRPLHAALGAKRMDAPTPTLASGLSQHQLLTELHSMKELIEERFNTLAWLGQARHNPIQSNLMLKLIRAGYSPALSRAVLEHLPEQLGAADAVRWLMDVLERNLRTDHQQLPLHEEGGIYALVGSTGVGKTTTAAKLAALCARQYGPGSVGLITLDTYRIGAHEQLRSYGRMLGVVAHLAHDRAALQDLLGLLSSKKMVLIDTTGVAPRDPRRRDMLDVLNLPEVQRLLVLNAASHGDTLDDVLTGFKTTGVQHAILSKVDEAVKYGPAIDALIRHQMLLRGVTNGQRVPEDWESADAHKLVGESMRAQVKSAFDPKEIELNYYFSPGVGELAAEGQGSHVA